MPAEHRSPFCAIHKAVHQGAKDKVEHGLYSRGRYLSPKVKDLYEAFLQDNELFTLHHELAAFKAYFYIYLETCSSKNLLPDPKALAMFLECMGRTIERVTGKKFQLTINGTAMVIERIAVVLEKNMLETQPELLQEIVKQLADIRLDPDDLEGAPTTGQLEVAHGRGVVKSLKRANG